MGILALIFGNLAWRMLCEAAILLFSLHEILVSLEDKADFLATHYANNKPFMKGAGHIDSYTRQPGVSRPSQSRSTI